MPHGPLFDERQTDIVLVGTTNITPDEFMGKGDNENGTVIENPQELTIKLVSDEKKFTYRIKIVDVRSAKQLSTGEMKVVYQKPGTDAERTNTVRIPREFSIVEMST